MGTHSLPGVLGCDRALRSELGAALEVNEDQTDVQVWGMQVACSGCGMVTASCRTGLGFCSLLSGLQI